jgi:RNA recognition motif-containing protein
LSQRWWQFAKFEGKASFHDFTSKLASRPDIRSKKTKLKTIIERHHMARAQVIRDKNSAQSRGFAFVTFAHPHEATYAQSMMNGRTLYGAFGGRSIRVGPSNRACSLTEE